MESMEPFLAFMSAGELIEFMGHCVVPHSLPMNFPGNFDRYGKFDNERHQAGNFGSSGAVIHTMGMGGQFVYH